MPLLLNVLQLMASVPKSQSPKGLLSENVGADTFYFLQALSKFTKNEVMSQPLADSNCHLVCCMQSCIDKLSFLSQAELEMSNSLGCLGDAAVRRRTCDRKVTGSTRSQGAIKSTRSTQPSIPPGQVNRVPVCMAGVRRGAFTCAGRQVALCDPIWQVTSRSSEVGIPPGRAISAFTCVAQATWLMQH